MTNGTIICIISYWGSVGSTGAFVVVATTMRMHIRKWSWLQYLARATLEWDDCSFPSSKPSAFPLYPHLALPSLLPFFCCWRSHVFNLAPEVLTVLYPGQSSTACGSHIGFYLHLLTQYIFSLLNVSEVYAKKSQIYKFSLGLVIRRGQSNIHHLCIYFYIYQRIENQIFLLTINASFFYVLLKSLHLNCCTLGVWGEEKQLLPAGCATEPSLLRQH